MRHILSLLSCGLLLAGSAIVYAQRPATSQPQSPYSQAQPGTETQNPSTMPMHTASHQQETLNGTVESFQAGRSIKINANGTNHKYNLMSTKTTVNVNPDVKVGSRVTVTEKIDNSGHKTIEIARR